jgi:hypothetical protein
MFAGMSASSISIWLDGWMSFWQSGMISSCRAGMKERCHICTHDCLPAGLVSCNRSFTLTGMTDGQLSSMIASAPA